MHRARKSVLIFPAAMLIAAVFSRAADLFPAPNPAWKEKPFRQWNEEDARQVLADSPWVGFTTLRRVRDLSPDERRDSGDWDADIGSGVGAYGAGIFGPRMAAE